MSHFIFPLQSDMLTLGDNLWDFMIWNATVVTRVCCVASVVKGPQRLQMTAHASSNFGP